MKKYTTKQFDANSRIMNSKDGTPIALARADTDRVSTHETYHAHTTAHEIYIFLRGKAIMVVEGNEFIVQTDDVIHIEPGEFHTIKDIIEKVDYITIRTNTDKDKKIIKEKN